MADTSAKAMLISPTVPAPGTVATTVAPTQVATVLSNIARVYGYNVSAQYRGQLAAAANAGTTVYLPADAAPGTPWVTVALYVGAGALALLLVTRFFGGKE